MRFMLVVEVLVCVSLRPQDALLLFLVNLCVLSLTRAILESCSHSFVCIPPSFVPRDMAFISVRSCVPKSESARIPSGGATDSDVDVVTQIDDDPDAMWANLRARKS
jgi:hypothetical protein